MLLRIYATSLWAICFLMLALLTGWTCLCRSFKRKNCVITNTALSLVAISFILYVTILIRTPWVCEVSLQPFATLAAAQEQPELYREMLMNVFLFFPLGLTLSNALPRSWRRWSRILLTILIGCAFSAGIEYAQYRFALGVAEADDVLCNTLGAFIGSTSLLIAHAIEKHRGRSRVRP